MKVTLDGQAYFDRKKVTCATDDEDDVPIEIVGAPNEELEPGKILIVHKVFSLELSASDLERALRVFLDR